MTTTESGPPPRARRRRERGAGERSEPLGNHCAQGVTAEVERADPVAGRRERRAEALRWRSRLWGWTSLPRLRNCGRVTHTRAGGPVVRMSEDETGARRTGLAGLQSCGSPWSCPVCARRIGARRAAEVREVVQAVADRGGSAALVTMTMRHRPGMALSLLWAALSAAWSAVTSGAAWKADKAAFGVVGWLRTVEATIGENGWHLHVHALVVFDGPVSHALMEEIGYGMFGRWERALERKGLSAVAERGGLDVREVQMSADSLDRVSDYLSKVAFEITSPSTKDGRHGNRAPFALLRDALATGLADDCDLWLEWERASHNRRQLTWSQGLREWARLGREATDEEIVAEDLRGEDVLAIAPESWPSVREDVSELLDVIEVDGVAAGIRWLTARGAGWFVPGHHQRGDDQDEDAQGPPRRQRRRGVPRRRGGR